MRPLPSLLAIALFCLPRAGFAADPLLIDNMDAADFSGGPKVEVRAVDGKIGKAVQFTYADDSKSVFATGRARGGPEWDKAAGISFWVKGDGSQHLGGIQFVWNERYDIRYDCTFPLESTEWKKVTIPWRDFIPVLPTADAKPLDPQTGNAPSKLGPVWFGRWWYWRDVSACSFAVDEIRLEPSITVDNQDYKQAGAPLARVRAKLSAGQPITIVTMGDSLTDYRHWSNHDINWPTLLTQMLQEQYKSKATIINPAIGGTQLRQNVVLIPSWIHDAPAPDLVTVFFGGNDWEAGMRGEMFYEAQKDAIDRIRRATKGKSDVLILTTCPNVSKWDDYAQLADGCRRAAAEKNAGLADVYAAFHQDTQGDHSHLFASDKVHMGADGHAVIAKTVLAALESGGSAGK